MSGTETLVPYLNKKKGNGQEPTIVVDSREANTAAKIVKGLRERGCTVEIQLLQKGDYILSDVCAVERKTVRDFVYTLTHRYLFDQLFKLKEAYPKALILLEGYLPIIYKFSRIKPASVWGAMFNLAKNRTPTIHPIKKVETISDAQTFFVSSLPKIGREKATAILKCYQTPLNALINVDDWPKAVHGLGPKISHKAKEVLTTPFRG
jgi:ERCC4-type nuclease